MLRRRAVESLIKRASSTVKRTLEAWVMTSSLSLGSWVRWSLDLGLGSTGGKTSLPLIPFDLPRGLRPKMYTGKALTRSGPAQPKTWILEMAIKKLSPRQYLKWDTNTKQYQRLIVNKIIRPGNCWNEIGKRYPFTARTQMSFREGLRIIHVRITYVRNIYVRNIYVRIIYVRIIYASYTDHLRIIDASFTDHLRIIYGSLTGIIYGSLTDQLRIIYGSLTDNLRIIYGSFTHHSRIC